MAFIWLRPQGSDFGELPTNVQGNCRLTAQYTDVWFVKYVNSDGTVLQTKRVPNGEGTSYSGSTPTKASTAQYTYSFSGWSSGGTNGAVTNVTESMTITAQYTSTVRTYTVYFYNGSTLLQTVPNVAYGGSATYTGTTPVSPDGTAEEGYEFTGWNPQPTNITGNTSCYAQFGTPMVDEEITDDWETIRKNVANGIHTKKYKVGNYKSIDLGNEGVINMQIVALGKDTLADGSGAAPITWIGKELLKTKHRMNTSLEGSEGAYTEGTGSIGGWEKSEMRAYLKDTVKPLIPAVTRKQIKAVSKTSYAFDTAGDNFLQQTSDDMWIPSHREIFKDSGWENTGPMYSAVYKDDASRIKKRPGDTSFSEWLLRSANGIYAFRCVTSFGSDASRDSYNQRYVALGFATGADTITDSWEEIIASMDDGTYATKYAVGDTKLLDLGSEGVVCATLVGIDVDDLADGSGKAKMTWLTEQLLKTDHRMNPARSGSEGAYTEGTGAIGGWEKSEMRSYMKTTLKPLIPEAIRNRIAEVTKTQPSFDTTGGMISITQTTQDDVWVPSHQELFNSNGLYHSVFPNNSSCIKQKPGTASSASAWWLRSAIYSGAFRCVNSNGSLGDNGASLSYGVALGFCLN